MGSIQAGSSLYCSYVALARCDSRLTSTGGEEDSVGIDKIAE